VIPILADTQKQEWVFTGKLLVTGGVGDAG